MFPKPLDHAILDRELGIVDSTGNIVHGSVAIGPKEKSWLFTPDSSWRKGSYSIQVGTTIADLAGNMVDRPFEIDVFERVDQSLNRTTRSISFNVD